VESGEDLHLASTDDKRGKQQRGGPSPKSGRGGKILSLRSWHEGEETALNIPGGPKVPPKKGESSECAGRDSKEIMPAQGSFTEWRQQGDCHRRNNWGHDFLFGDEDQGLWGEEE